MLSENCQKLHTKQAITIGSRDRSNAARLSMVGTSGPEL